MNCREAFIDCTSLSFSYNIFGIVQITYTMVHKEANFCYVTELDAGTRHFKGYVTNMTMNRVQGTSDWYETHVTLTADTRQVIVMGSCGVCGKRRRQLTEEEYDVMGGYAYLPAQQIRARLEVFKKRYCKTCPQRYECDYPMYVECKKKK